MPRAGLTAERLVDAAAQMADETGFEQVSLSALARRFDVKSASLYAHLSSTQDLRTRIALLALQEMADLVDRAVAGRAGEEALTSMADVYRDYAREHPGRYAASRLRLDPTTAAASAGARHAAAVRAVLRAYDLHGDDQTHAVRLIGSVVHGFIDQEAAGAFSHSRPGTQSSWEQVLRALDALLRHWPSSTSPSTAGGRGAGRGR